MINVNLLRPEKKEIMAGEKPVMAESERERQLSVPAIIGAAAITVVLIGALYFLQESKYQKVKKELEDNKITLQQKEYVLKKLQEVEEIKKALDQKVKVIGDLASRRHDAVKMMDKLSSSLPDWVWLTGLSYRGGLLVIDGRAMSNNLISDFISNLQNSTFFNSINMVSSSRSHEGLTDIFVFQLTCQYVRPQEDATKGV